MNIKTNKSIRPREAAEFLGIALPTLWVWVASRSDFPKRRKIGSRTTVFDFAELVAWREKHLSEV